MSKKPTLEIDGVDLTKLSPEEWDAWVKERRRTHPHEYWERKTSSGTTVLRHTNPADKYTREWEDSQRRVAYRQNGVAYNIHGNPVEDEGCILI